MRRLAHEVTGALLLANGELSSPAAAPQVAGATAAGVGVQLGNGDDGASGGSGERSADAVSECCCCILSMVCADPVYRVYVAALVSLLVSRSSV